MDYRVKVAVAIGVCALNCVLIGKESSKKKKHREKVARDAEAAIKAMDRVMDEIKAEKRERKLVYRDIYGNEKYTWIVSDEVK